MTGWDRVIAAVIERRAALGWTQKRLAEEAGVSERTIQNLEGGRRPQPVNRHKIETALGWAPGEFRRIEAAGAGKPLTPPNVRKAIRREIPEERREAALEAVEAALRGDPPPGTTELGAGLAAAG